MMVNGVTNSFVGASDISNAEHPGEAARQGQEFAIVAQAQIRNDVPAADGQTRPETATGARGVTTIHRGDGHDEVRDGGSRAWRDNNPGNLEYGPFARDHGAIGHDTGGGHHEAIFPDRATGEAAQRALLQQRYGNHTVRDTMYVYAPPTENDTEQYLQFLERNGVDRNARVRDLNEDQFNNLVTQIQTFEGWRAGTIRHQDAVAP